MSSIYDADDLVAKEETVEKKQPRKQPKKKQQKKPSPKQPKATTKKAPKKPSKAKKKPTKTSRPKKLSKEQEAAILEEVRRIQQASRSMKHLVTCNCILPQFRDMDDPPFHKFKVFSELDMNGAVKMSLESCPNCKAVHKVTDAGKSRILNREMSMALTTVDDIKTRIPEDAATILEQHKCELHTWKEFEFIYQNGLYPTQILLAKEEDEEMVVGKFLSILGRRMFKVDSFTEESDFIDVDS